MKIFHMMRGIIKSMRQEGLRTTMHRIAAWIDDFYFDVKYGTDTRLWADLNSLAIESDNINRGVRYQPTNIKNMRKVFQCIESMIPASGVFVDFGCGKGRVLLLASEFGFAKVRGVDFAAELCAVARSNCTAYQNRTGVKTEFRIIESDVVDYVINKEENVFFMYNPFDGVVMSRVLDNIAASLEMQPRSILIIYHNPVHSNIIEERGIVFKSKELTFKGSYSYVVYSNEDLGDQSSKNL